MRSILRSKPRLFRNHKLTHPTLRPRCVRSISMPKHIGIVGAGQMGTGIAKVAAHQGALKVTVMDAQPAQLDRAQKFIDDLMKKDVSKGKVTAEESRTVLSRVSMTHKMDDLSACDFVIEAATENPQLKFDIFKKLDQIVPKGVILASNTSSISIGAIGRATQRPEKVIGMHFMNPVPVMKLVEIIPSLGTDSNTLESTLHLAKQLGKTTTLSKDMPGFIANRLLCPYLNEAFFALQEGIGSPEDIDTTMKLGTNVPMGPLALADFIGLDTVLAIMRVLHGELGEDKYRPAPLLIKYVEAGWLGKKTGKGVFKYE